MSKEAYLYGEIVLLPHLQLHHERPGRPSDAEHIATVSADVVTVVISTAISIAADVVLPPIVARSQQRQSDMLIAGKDHDPVRRGLPPCRARVVVAGGCGVVAAVLVVVVVVLVARGGRRGQGERTGGAETRGPGAVERDGLPRAHAKTVDGRRVQVDAEHLILRRGEQVEDVARARC